MVIDRFLSLAYAKSEELAPGLGPCLVVLPSSESNADIDKAKDERATTTAGSAAGLPPSPFVGMSMPEIAELLGAPRNRHFVVMDSQSLEDDTVLLVTTAASDGGDDTSGQDEGAGLQTVRTTFDRAQSVLVSLDMGTLGFEEVRGIAAGNPGGVYGAERGDRVSPRKGGRAPRMVLGGH